MKKNILTVILDTVFIVVFNTLFFLNGGIQHVASVWIAYGFLHFAYLMVLVTPLIASKGFTADFSKTTTYTISLLFFFIELIFAVITFITKTEHIKLIISIETIICGIYIIILVINLFADDSLANKQQQHEFENNFTIQSSDTIEEYKFIFQGTALYFAEADFAPNKKVEPYMGDHAHKDGAVIVSFTSNQHMNGKRSCGTYTQWNITQP